jgi:hypothetical protein
MKNIPIRVFSCILIDYVSKKKFVLRQISWLLSIKDSCTETDEFSKMEVSYRSRCMADNISPSKRMFGDYLYANKFPNPVKDDNAKYRIDTLLFYHILISFNYPYSEDIEFVI